MFPIGDDDSRLRGFHIVTYALVAINVLVFLYEVLLGEQLEIFFQAYAVIPKEIVSGRDLPPLIAPLPVYTTLFTSMFMHGGFLHVAGNMLYLWIFGDNIEESMGSLRFLLFYLLCGLLASFAHIISNTGSRVPSLGASGAIAGVLGAYLLFFPHQRVRVWMGWLFGIVEMPAIIVIGFWGLLQFISGLGSLTARTAQTGGVAYWAHIGGFVAGLILATLFRKPKLKLRH
ncbi:MAG: rhomboid family intramembrane serine protease [Acidobacteriota bacterium]